MDDTTAIGHQLAGKTVMIVSSMSSGLTRNELTWRTMLNGGAAATSNAIEYAGSHPPNLDGNEFQPPAGYTPVAGDEYIVFQVTDRTDPPLTAPVLFNGIELYEGTVIAGFLGGTLPAYCTYVGGDGNDLVLVVQGPMNPPNPATADNVEVITRYFDNTDPSHPIDNIQYLIDGTVVDARPALSVTSITVSGTDFDDTLTVDFTGTGGDPLPSGGLRFDGGANPLGDSNVLVIQGTGTQNPNYKPSLTLGPNGKAGDIIIAGKTIHFANLDPVDFDTTGNVSLTLLGGDDHVTFADGVTVVGGQPAIVLTGDSGGVSFETPHIRNGSITVNTNTLDGVDAIVMTAANGTAAAANITNITINTAGGLTGDTVSITGAVAISGTLSLTANGTMTASGGGVVTAAVLSTSSAGGTAFGGANHVASFTGSNTTSGDIALRNAVAALSLGILHNSAATGSVSVTNAGAISASGAITTAGGLVDIAATAAGTLTVGGAIGTNGGPVSLSSRDALAVNGGITAAGGSVTLQANQDGSGAEGFSQADATTISGTGIALTVNTAGGTGTGGAVVSNLTDSGALQISTTNTATDAGGSITRTAASTLSATTGLTLTTGTGSIGTGPGASAIQLAAGQTNVVVTTHNGAIYLQGAGALTTMAIASNEALVNVAASGLLTVDGPISTASATPGTGGKALVGSGVALHSTLTLGAGDITLGGGGTAQDITITVDQSLAGNVTLTALGDIIVSAVLATTSGGHIALTAGTDDTGGVWIDNNGGTTHGQVNSAGTLAVTGRDLTSTVAPTTDAIVLNGPIQAAGNLTLSNGSGAPPGAGTYLNNTISASAGNIQVSNPVTLTGSSSVTNTGGGNIALGSTIDADAAANHRTLVVTAGTGAGTRLVTFSGIVGGAQALADLDVTGTRIDLNATGLTVNAAVASQIVTFTGGVVLGANMTITTGGSVDNDLTFTSTINADDASLADRTLQVAAGAATVRFQGAIGDAQPLADWDVSGNLIRLGGNVTVDDGTSSVSLTGAAQLDASLTIDTDGTNDGSLTFVGAASTIDAATAGTQSLTVTAGTGAVTFGSTIGTGAALQSLSVTTSGQISLGGNIATDTNAGSGDVGFSGGGNVVLTNTVVLATEQGGDGGGGAVSFGSSTVSGDAAGRDLTITTAGGVGVFNGGNVTLASFNAVGGGHYVQTLLLTTTAGTGGGTAGRLTLSGSTIYLDDDGAGGLASLTLVGNGETLLTTNVTIDTQQGTGVNGGNVAFPMLGTITGAGRELTIDVRGTTFLTADDGNIQLAGRIGTTGGALGSLTVLADRGTITVGNNGAGTATINSTQTNGLYAVLFGSNTVLTAHTSYNTGGGVADYSDTIFSSNAAGPWTLTINTTDGGIGNDGDLYLAGANDVAGGRYLSTVTLTATGDAGGTAGNLTLINDAGATVDFRTADANFTFAGGAVIVSDTTTIDTDQINGTPSGAVHLDSSRIYASTTGLSLTLSTATTGAVAGAVTLGPVGNGGGGAGQAYLQSLVINTNGGVTDGIVRPNGDIRVDSGAVTIDGDIRWPQSTTIDTEQDGVGPGGAVDLAVTSGSLSATPAAVSFNLTINTTTTAAGQSGGPVTLGALDNSGGSYVTDLTVTTSGTGGDVRFTLAAATVGKIKVNSGHDITVAVGGSVNSGGYGTVAGTDIGMYALSGTILVNGPLSSTMGSGGSIDISGGVTVNANVTSGAGPITLNGSLDAGTDLDINSPAVIHGAGTVRLTAARDVLIGGTVETELGSGADIRVTADSPANGVGGVRIEPTGLVASDHDVNITGSNLFATVAPVDYVLIDADGTNDQVRAVRNITLAPQAATPASADAVIDGRVRATGAGGAISITAPNDVVGAATGDLFTNNGTIGITAAGTVQLAGDITAAGGLVTFSLADCDGWIGATPGSGDGNIEPLVAAATAVVKSGSGILRLNGRSNQYTGTTTVNDGTLLINGELLGAGGTVTVTPLPAGSTPVLGGNGFGAGVHSTGTINRDVSIAAGGILDPGDCHVGYPSFAPSCTPQPGQLTVNGNVALVAGATFRVQLNGVKPGMATAPPPNPDGDGGYDQLAVNGAVTLGGSTLQTSVGFAMPVGATYRIIDNNDTDPVNNQFQGLAEGDFFYAGTYVMNISYQSGDQNNDVTLTHPGRYDFDANPSDTQPWYESVGPAPFYGPLYPASSPGWNATVLEAGRGGSEGTGLPQDLNTPVRLLRDLAVTGSQATFLVDALAKDTMTGQALQYQVLITSGDYGYAHNGSQFQVGDSDHPNQQTVKAVTDQAEFAQLIVRPITIDELVHDSYLGQLRVLMQYVGGLSGWTAVINGIDIRPLSSVGNILFTRNSATHPTPPQPTFSALEADGLTIDTYYGWDATPSSLITVTTTLGTVLPPTGTADADRYLQGLQILSDINGHFSFRIQRPSGTGTQTGTGDATITAWDIGGRSYAAVTQTYNQDYSTVDVPTNPIGYRRFDFNSSSSPTAAGFLGVLPDVPYTDANGYGWVTPVGAVDRLQSTDWLRRDFHWAQAATFQVQGIPGQTYSLRALFGEPTDGVLYESGPNMGQLGASGASFGEGSANDATSQNPTTITITVNGTASTLTKPWPNQFVDTLPGTLSGTADTNGIVSIAFSASGGVEPYFAIDGLAIWQASGPPVGSPQLLSVDVPTGGGTGAVVTQTSLGLLVAEARDRWQAFGLTDAQLATLRAMNYGVADLPGQQLASTDANGTLIAVDQNAHGCGWFIDPTPWEDSEYVLGQAPPGVDLLTVVMHEMGHALGYTDLDTSQYPEALMALQLMPEQARRVPTGPLVTGTNPLLPSDVNGDGNVTPTDVLQLVNRINRSGGPLTPVESDSSPTFYDVSGDNVLSASDVLRIVNFLNTPLVAQTDVPAFVASGSPSPLIAVGPIVPPAPPAPAAPAAPAGSSTTAADAAAPASDQVAMPAAGRTVCVAPAAEDEDWLDHLAADVHATLPDALAADALFQEWGRS